MLTAGGGYSTTYDALGRMVEVQTGASSYKDIVYSPAGKKMAVVNTTSSGTTLAQGFIPLPGGGTAVYGPPSGSTPVLAYYRHVDHLGSSRLATTPTRTLYSSTAYGPYGEPYDMVSTRDVSFTGADEDTMQGMNDFLYRKYTPSEGRWLSPDPSGLKATNPSSPQSWNRYAYVLNNPMAATDPTGLDCVYDNGDGTTSTETGDCASLTDDGVYVDGTIDPETSTYFDDNGNLWATYEGDNGLIMNSPCMDSSSCAASVQIVGYVSHYYGPWPMPDGPINDTNAWQEQVVDSAGQPVGGNFSLQESLVQGPNLNATPATAGPPWYPGPDGLITDNVGLMNPQGIVMNMETQTFTVTYPNSTYQLSTVINQYSIYQNGTLVVGNPAIAHP